MTPEQEIQSLLKRLHSVASDYQSLSKKYEKCRRHNAILINAIGLSICGSPDSFKIGDDPVEVIKKLLSDKATRGEI